MKFLVGAREFFLTVGGAFLGLWLMLAVDHRSDMPRELVVCEAAIFFTVGLLLLLVTYGRSRD
jgi:hypothetical protein